jgi:alcohol dehydrogenase (cytochrome c)
MTASALATAGGIVFGGTADREFFALNSETGELLWQTRLNGDVSGAPITFEVDGKQYVAVTAGGRTGPTTSFGPLTNVTLSEGSGVVWVFAAASDKDTLSSRRLPPPSVVRSTSGVAVTAARGNAPATSPASATADTRSALNGVFTSAQASRGAQQFKQACAACHSIEEQANSLNAKWGKGTLRDLFTVISTTMPQNKAGSLSPDEYASIVAFYLQESGHTPGSSELPADPAALERMRVAASR